MSTNPLDVVIEELRAAVEENTTIGQSAVTLIEGIPALIQAAVDQATSAGATPAQLQAIKDLKVKMTAETEAFKEALEANT